MSRASVPKLLKEAAKIKEVLEKIGEPLPGGVSFKEITKKIDNLTSILKKLNDIEAERTKAVNNKESAAKELSDFIVKARLAIKVEFGADSSEYEMAGGTRGKRKEKARNGQEVKEPRLLKKEEFELSVVP